MKVTGTYPCIHSTYTRVFHFDCASKVPNKLEQAPVKSKVLKQIRTNSRKKDVAVVPTINMRSTKIQLHKNDPFKLHSNCNPNELTHLY